MKITWIGWFVAFIPSWKQFFMIRSNALYLGPIYISWR